MIFRVIILFLLNIDVVLARDISTEMNDFLDGIGFDANVTKEHRYKGQSAGYYTGGSIYARNRVINTPVANVQFPNISAGCGGIDMYAGGFSFINEDQFVALMKGIASNAVGFAFQLAMDTLSPSISSNLKNLRTAVNRMNNFNINSCNAAKTAVNSTISVAKRAYQNFCKLSGNNKGSFSDYAASSQGCRNASSVSSAKNSASAVEKNDLPPQNLTWDILTKNGNADQEYNEVSMSLLGTLIISETSGNFSSKYLPATIFDDDTRAAILFKGGSIPVYRCNNDACTSPVQETRNIEKSFRTTVSEIIEGIQNKIREEAFGAEGDTFSAKEKAFIQNSPFPIYKIINVQLSYEKASSIFSLDELVDYLAVDMLYGFLDKIVFEAQIKYKSHPGLSDANKVDFMNHISDLRMFIEAERKQVARKLNDLSTIVMRVEEIEKKLQNELGAKLYKTMSMRGK